jgi:ribosomal protein S18 acetylase RimI-like enzyme
VRKTKLKNRHRAAIGIALLQEYWGLGIGTALFRELIAQGEEWGLKQLELEVIEGNERGLALYRKTGFEITGAVPNAIRMPDGSFVREFYMVKPLKK